MDPHSGSQIMHLMRCPASLQWDNAAKNCMHESKTCPTGRPQPAPGRYPQGGRGDTRHKVGGGRPVPHHIAEKQPQAYHEQATNNNQIDYYGGDNNNYYNNNNDNNRAGDNGYKY